MAKFCPNCGQELAENAVFCPNCGNAIAPTVPVQPAVQPTAQPVQPVVQPVQVAQPASKSDGAWVLISAGILVGLNVLSYLLGIVGVAIAATLSGFAFVFGLAALIILIIGLVKYPKNKGIKIFFWIYLGVIILKIILIIILILACGNMITDLIGKVADAAESGAFNSFILFK